MTVLALEAFTLDPDCQPRAELRLDTVAEYAAAFADGDQFPPVMVFFDGVANWLADGFHRHAGATAAGIETLDADIRPGTRRDAILYSLGVNATHGLRRTNADKRRSVMTMLADPEWARWSDREIARQCAVSHEFVRQIREPSVNVDRYPRTVTRNGTTYEMNMSGLWQANQERESDEATELVEKTLTRLQDSGEEITSVADLKRTMREVWREDHPPPPPAAMTENEVSKVKSDHTAVDTFGVVRAVVRHAEANPIDDQLAAKIDKWTRLNILDDLPAAIAYLTDLNAALKGAGQ
jgi:hypothetical protein